MKVTVCFGSVRVLVPCGTGELLVRDLVREATLRYKKATGQGPETWVGVRALRASSGGILDLDDRVGDVADDRETLTAECTTNAPHRAAQADGASGSSAGTASPDMFRGGGGVGGSMRVPNPDSCVEVGEADLEGGAGLQVRRGSEPSLHQDTLPPQRQSSEQTKRWSAAVVCRDDVKPQKLPPDPPPDRGHLHPGSFQRQSNRLSMQFSGPGSGAWMEAADRAISYGSKSLPRDARREPLGQDTTVPHKEHDTLRWVTGVNDHALDLLPEGNGERAITGIEVPVGVGTGSTGTGSGSSSAYTVSVRLVKGPRGLGFTVTTRDNPTAAGPPPVYIKNILPQGAAVSDGRLRAGDRLLRINDTDVRCLPQSRVVSLLRATPPDCAVDLLVERPAHSNTAGDTTGAENQRSPTYTEKAIGSPTSVSSPDVTDKPVTNGKVSSIVNAINSNKLSNGGDSVRLSKEELRKNKSSDSLHDVLNTSNGSLGGGRGRSVLRLRIPVHDSEKAGLGVSVKGKVTLAAPARDLGIFVKSVLHGGAASRDGRLHTNDQLLSVNEVSLSGQSNEQAMDTLRRALLVAPPASRGYIHLTVARRTDSMDSLARWKDDTPPSNDNTNSSNDNTQYNTVLYNNNNLNERSIDRSLPSYDDIRDSKRHSSIITINNNSWVSEEKGYLERDKDTSKTENKRDSFEWSRLDGWNPVIDKLTGGLRNESYYMATHNDGPTVNGHGNFRPNHGHLSRSPPVHHNVIIEEDYGSVRVGSRTGTTVGAGCESSSECGSGAGGGGAGGPEGAFSRSALGRRSMSEKRHAALDAKATGTYQRIKDLKKGAEVGPALGMRKSSSLESLQIAIQETKRNPHSEPIYARAHPPLKHWLTDDQNGGEMVRGSPQQSSLSHKKPSILKSLSTMFRIGKPSKNKTEPEGIYGRSGPGRASEKSLTKERNDRNERNERSERTEENPPQQRPPVSHSRQSSGRSEGAEERRHRALPARTSPAALAHQPQMMEGAWGPTGHYVNYDEIQQNLNTRREKLSSVQIGQMRRQVVAQRAKVDDETRRAVAAGYHSQRSCREAPPRPQSNYYEYETAPPRRPGKLSHYH